MKTGNSKHKTIKCPRHVCCLSVHVARGSSKQGPSLYLHGALEGVVVTGHIRHNLTLVGLLVS